jgi:hypothetical protein
MVSGATAGLGGTGAGALMGGTMGLVEVTGGGGAGWYAVEGGAGTAVGVVGFCGAGLGSVWYEPLLLPSLMFVVGRSWPAGSLLQHCPMSLRLVSKSL